MVGQAELRWQVWRSKLSYSGPTTLRFSSELSLSLKLQKDAVGSSDLSPEALAKGGSQM